MLRDYRDWLKSELKLLGNASHHAYSFGQANMAKRALDELDKALGATFAVAVDKVDARRALTELEMLAERESTLTPGLIGLRDSLRAALTEAELPADEGV